MTAAEGWLVAVAALEVRLPLATVELTARGASTCRPECLEEGRKLLLLPPRTLTCFAWRLWWLLCRELSWLRCHEPS